MNLASQYHAKVSEQLREIAETQTEAIEQAASELGRTIVEGHWLYLFGTGHSHMLAEELFYRAGGLHRIRPMLFPPLMLHESAYRSTEIERDANVVDQLLKDYPIGPDDLLLIASNSGRNAVPVELALRAMELGARVIALTNRRHAAAFPSRHPSGKKLSEVATLSIDNCGVVGDACVPVPDHSLNVGAASTVTGAAIVQMIACGAVEFAVERGWKPQVFASANAGQEAENDALVQDLLGTVRHL
ncbi:MAG: SIS domain-containing protein [Planctomycetota bacterium]